MKEVVNNELVCRRVCSVYGEMIEQKINVTDRCSRLAIEIVVSNTRKFDMPWFVKRHTIKSSKRRIYLYLRSL